MPTYPKHACGRRGCATLVERGHHMCEAHRRDHQRTQERERGTANERGYDARWARARLRFLRDHPLCVVCLAAGRVTPARVVDHVVAHRGDQTLFWDERNWQSLCDFTSPFNCHGSKTSREANERRR